MSINKNKIKKFVIISIAVVATTIVCSLIFLVISTHPKRDSASMLDDVRDRLIKSGRAEEACKEADQIFARFGVSQLKFLSSAELKDFPSIASLGKVDGIWPGNPAHIKIRVGTHSDGYMIMIVPTNLPLAYANSSNTFEIVKSRIYVHR